MKTNEFIKKVNELGFNVIEKQFIYANETWLIVREAEHATIMGVEKNTRYMIAIDHGRFEYLDDDTKEELFNIAVEYAKTPIEEKKEEKKYYLRLPIFGYDDEQNYLNLERDTGKYLFGSKKNIDGYQTQFSQKEIDEMKKKYNLDSFEVAEVQNK